MYTCAYIYICRLVVTICDREREREIKTKNNSQGRREKEKEVETDHSGPVDASALDRG